MELFYLWPDNPVASLFILWLASVIFLWAARESMLRLIGSTFGGLADGLAEFGLRCRGTAYDLNARNREILLAAGTRDAQGRLDRELQRVDDGFSQQLSSYDLLQRRLDESLIAAETEFDSCRVAPPEVPGWTAAVEAIAAIPTAGDPNIQKVLESIKKSSKDAEARALDAFRADASKRHKVLRGMAPIWKDIKSLLGKLQGSVGLALESSARINAFVADYENIRLDREAAARALTYSAMKLFFVSFLVLGIALGAAFINFQLIALPMSELVPAGVRVGGVPVSTVSALVLVLMEAVLGIFVMDILGLTQLFPKIGTMPRSRRRPSLWPALLGLFLRSTVESSLAVLREQIVEADAALKLSLAGESERLVQNASQSSIPVIGQAILGFILPWILALVAVPLEMLLDSVRHVVASLCVLTLRAFSLLMSGAARVSRHLSGLLTYVYDIYIALPLKIESLVRSNSDTPDGELRAPAYRRVRDSHRGEEVA